MESVVLHFVPVKGWLSLVLYLVPYFVIGYDILKKAFKGILNRQVFDENFLMAVATVGAIILGEYTEGVAVMLFYQIGELFQSYAFLNLEPAVVGSFSDRVLVQFDEGRPRALPLRALMGGSAVLLQDKTFLKDLASARKLYVRLDLFGAPAQTMAFDLGDVKGVMKWLDEADAVRS